MGHTWQNVGPKRSLRPRDIWTIRFYPDEHKRLRDRALFDLASGGAIRNRPTVIQQKTGLPVQFEIMAEARKSLLAWLEWRKGSLNDFVFPSRIDYMGHISTCQYARLLDEWVSTIGLDKREYGTHSMQRTKAALIYKATGNLRAIQILSGHTNIEHTVRYLSVDADDALTLSERTEIRAHRRPIALPDGPVIPVHRRMAHRGTCRWVVQPLGSILTSTPRHPKKVARHQEPIPCLLPTTYQA